MKFSKKLLFLTLFLGLIVYLFYTAFNDIKGKTLGQFDNGQFNLARQASRGIESFFNYYQRELLFLSGLDYISNLDQQGKELLREFYFHHSDQIKAITFVDSLGILIYTYPEQGNVIGRDISDQEHIRAVISSHKAVVSDVFTSVQGYRTIAYHIPIIKEKKYLGSLAILIPVDDLGKRFIENIRTGETGYGSIISEDGIILYSPDTSAIGNSIGENYTDIFQVNELKRRILNEGQGTAKCNNPEAGKKNKKTEKICAFFKVPLGNTYWTILIITPEKEVYANFKSFRDRMYLLFALVILVMLVYFYLAFKAWIILSEESKRKALENVLRESEKRFRVMFELSPAGIILIDTNGKIIEVNPSFCETLGYSRKELISNNIRMFASPLKSNDIEVNIGKILKGNTLRHEVTNIRKDGTKCVIALYETLILLPDGKPGILSVSNDITERKRAEEKMLTLSKAMESIGECVSITDLNNKILFTNNSFCKTYGYEQKELIGRDITIVRSDKTDEAQVKKILEDTLQGGWTGEVINIRKDGSEFPIELTTSFIADENGQPVALIGVATDSTERKKVYQELIFSKEKAEESDRLKSTFLTNMSHELRTPLNAIIGFSSFMAETASDTETASYSKIIFESGQHLLKLVEDILDTSLIEIGQLKINNEKVEIIALLNEVKNIITGERIREEKTHVEIILNTNHKITERTIITDSRKLKQILINLLKNALKYTDHGFIEFGFTEIERSGICYLKFYVKDTGIGIDSKFHEVIFNVFRQVDETYTRPHGGTGIGLSIVKSIVEMLKGQIWVESELGKGSTFSFTIPVICENLQTDARVPTGQGRSEESYTGKTLLIAEDEDSNYEFLRIYLSRYNIKVLRAKNGLEATELCDKYPSIDMVMMDIKMPLLNGLEATKLIKKKHPTLPVIAQTAYAMASDKEAAISAGCDDYISKPIQIDALAELLNRYLRQKE